MDNKTELEKVSDGKTLHEQMQDIAKKVLIDLLDSDVCSAKEISVKYSIPLEKSISIMSSPEFIDTYTKLRDNLLKVQLLSKGYKRVLDIIDSSESDDTALRAVRLLADLLGLHKDSPAITNTNVLNIQTLKDLSKDMETIDVEPDGFPGFE